MNVPVYLDDLDATFHAGDAPPRVAAPWVPPEVPQLAAVDTGGESTYLNGPVGNAIGAERMDPYPSPRRASNMGLDPFDTTGEVPMGGEVMQILDSHYQADTPATKPMYFTGLNRGPHIEPTPDFIYPAVITPSVTLPAPQPLGSVETAKPTPMAGVGVTRNTLILIGALAALGAGAYFLSN
jgi:hypothetical protein